MKILFTSASFKAPLRKYFFQFILSIRFISVLLVSNCEKIRAQELDNHTTVSIIICSPNDKTLLTSFGHCAIHMQDEIGDINDVYHYGVINFSDLNFYSDLVRQKLKASFVAQNYNLFKPQYTFFNRELYEYELNLTLKQKQKILDFLNWNARPENLEYTYQYFSNNCATKLRDALVNSLQNEIQIKEIQMSSKETYRSLLKPHLYNRPWTELLFDFYLGLPADLELSTKESMFLPTTLIKTFKSFIIKNGNQCLSRSEIGVLNRQVSISYFSFVHPITSCLLVSFVLITLSLWDLKRNRVSWFVDGTTHAITGFAGMSILVAWLVFNNHQTAFNMNVLWAPPTNLLVIIMPIKIRMRYCLVAASVCFLLLLGWAFLPQKLNYAFMPIVVGLCFRYLVAFRYLRIKYLKTKMSNLSV